MNGVYMYVSICMYVCGYMSAVMGTVCYYRSIPGTSCTCCAVNTVFNISFGAQFAKRDFETLIRLLRSSVS